MTKEQKLAEDLVEDVTVRPREVHFDLSAAPLHWIPGEPLLSHAFSAFHIALSLGERGFVDSFKRGLPYVKDDSIREEMIGFIGQEGVHADVHNRAVWEFLERHGLDLGPMVKEADYGYDRMIAAIDRLPERLRYAVIVQMLAMTAAAEHMTNTLSYWVLSNFDFEVHDADPTLSDMFRWHCSEEVEHRCVAWNVAQYFGVGRARLAPMAAVVALAFPFAAVAGAWLLIRRDPTLPKMNPVRVFWEFTKAQRRGEMPPWSLMRHAAAACAYRDYSPASTGNASEALAYLAKSRAVKQRSAT
ncbi:metal-dependent hydrolase [Gordonia sp. CPCC 205333]|uniref:metal-dependent hydrolase n=1 Tax=Gordonia sp. CPCC 205333 TaxID=3140790 RepID=UPI003AF3B0F4